MSNLFESPRVRTFARWGLLGGRLSQATFPESRTESIGQRALKARKLSAFSFRLATMIAPWESPIGHITPIVPVELVSRPRAIFHSNILLPVSLAVPVSPIFTTTSIPVLQSFYIPGTLLFTLQSEQSFSQPFKSQSHVNCLRRYSIAYPFILYLVSYNAHHDLTQSQYCLPIDLSLASTAYHSSPQGAFINHVFTASRLFIALEQL